MARMYQPILLLAVVVFLPGPRPAQAVDASDGVIAPELRIEPSRDFVMPSAVIHLSDKSVDITWTGRVQRGVRAYFVGQRFRWRGESDPYPDRQFPELQLLVDGVAANTESSASAWAGSMDVSGLIRAAGLDPFVISQSPPLVAPHDVNSASFRALEQSGAVVSDAAGYLARWSAQRTVAVQIPGGHERSITVRYTARPAFARSSLPEIAERFDLTHYCVSVSRLARLVGSRTEPVVINEYSIPTGVDGVPPPGLRAEIGNLRDNGRPMTLAVLCAADGNVAVVRSHLTLRPRTDGEGVLHVLAIRISSGSSRVN